ncbi:MAG: NAD(P)H-hydrate dehydratase [candidate division WOR-3 bacterium]
MRRVVNHQEMREIDQRAEKEFSIPSLILMENAGHEVVRILKDYLRKELKGYKVWVFAGKGNNGGDGFVVARYLKNEKAEVKVFLFAKEEELKGDAQKNYEIIKKIGLEIIEIKEEKFSLPFEKPDIVIDALFGTGFSGKPNPLYRKAIEFINNSDALVLSIDIPSGVSEKGKVEDIAVKANLTVTMGLIKDSLILFPGKKYVGRLAIADIGIPNFLLEKEGDKFLLEKEDIKKIFPQRIPEGNKGTFGKVLVIAGSLGFSGAASLTALSALRIGSGLVRLASLREIMPALEAKLTEVVKIPLPQEEEGSYSIKVIPIIDNYLKDTDVIALGPGIGTKEKTKEFLLSLLPKIEKPLVIDADGINNLIGELAILKKMKGAAILTPHPGELGRLLNLSPQEINENRIEVAKEFAIKYNIILVLKGAPTVIGTPEGKVFFNPTGNSGLASGGTGDVLTGFIAGLLSQGLDPLNSALSGVYLHGLCADIGVKEKTEYAFIASDILDYLPLAIKEITG